MTDKIWILLAVVGPFCFTSCKKSSVCCREPESLSFQYISTENVDLLDHRNKTSKYYYHDIWIEDIVREGNAGKKSKVRCGKGRMGNYDPLSNTTTDRFKYIVYGYDYSRDEKNLLYTLIHLNNNKTDTVRFVHTGRFGNYCPDTVYYNNKVLEVKTPPGSLFHYCTIIK